MPENVSEKTSGRKKSEQPPRKPHRRLKTGLWVIACSLVAAFGGAWATWAFGPGFLAQNSAGQSPPVVDADQRESVDSSTVSLPKSQWGIAGIKLGQVERREIRQQIWVTGKVALNEDRLAQIDPLVEGIVDKVNVQFGDEVTAREVLAVIDSREVGQAKLELVKNRLATRLAEAEATWQEEIETNVQELIRALEQGCPIADLETKFHNKPMGNYREQLVSAYARLHKSRADYDRLKQLSEQGVTAGKTFIAAKATYEADQATFQALLEQIKFSSQRERISAEQSLQEARTSEEISETNLRILGVSPKDAITTAPSAAGKAVSHYLITAPFDGTIIQKDIVLLERVGPNAHLFEIADLSTVWVEADIYERQLSLLQGLHGVGIRFRSKSYPGRIFQADVFFTGEVISPTSRTLPLRAIARNPERLLKPGMFVEVELPAGRFSSALVVPASAVQEHADSQFVFVHSGGETFARRVVTLGQTLDDVVEVRQGLREGEPIVVQGGFFLKSRMLESQFADED